MNCSTYAALHMHAWIHAWQHLTYGRGLLRSWLRNGALEYLRRGCASERGGYRLLVHLARVHAYPPDW